VVGDDGDPGRAAAFLNVLDQHQIEYSLLTQDVRAGDLEFKSGEAWVLPVNQRQFGLLEAMMEVRTEFEDDYFYDVSAWTQPLAYNLPYAELSRLPQSGPANSPLPGPAPDENPAAWVIPWNQLQAAAVLQELLEAGALVRAAVKPFNANTSEGTRAFERGALVVHPGMQSNDAATKARNILTNAVIQGLDVSNVTSSLTPIGPDLGSLNFKPIRPVKALMITGNDVSTQSAGHAWHHMDQHLGFAPVMVGMDRLSRIRLADYTHFILVDGSYSDIGNRQKQRIAQWVLEGGMLIASSRGSTWAESLCFSGNGDGCKKDEKDEEKETPADQPYANHSNDAAKLVIGGAIASAVIDTTHPIGFGYPRNSLPLFRRGTTMLEASDNAYSTPVRYAENALIAGYIGDQRQSEMSAQPAVIAERKGAGLVIRFANNPVFRGFWRGTERLFNNALYMGQVIESTNLPD
jgi:hypothetical protein